MLYAFSFKKLQNKKMGTRPIPDIPATKNPVNGVPGNSPVELPFCYAIRRTTVTGLPALSCGAIIVIFAFKVKMNREIKDHPGQANS
jgi:hypothetical protein